MRIHSWKPEFPLFFYMEFSHDCSHSRDALINGDNEPIKSPMSHLFHKLALQLIYILT